MGANDNLVLALPRGRILKEVMLLVRRAGTELEAAFDGPGGRQLKFAANVEGLEIICVRSFDLTTFVVFVAAHLSVVGNDGMTEFDCPDLCAPLDLDFSHCRLSVSDHTRIVNDSDPNRWGSIRITNKCPNLNSKNFVAREVRAGCVKLSGANEPAPVVELCSHIVNLASSGSAFKANGSTVTEKICNINACLTVKRTAWKTRLAETNDWLENFREAANDLAA